MSIKTDLTWAEMKTEKTARNADLHYYASGSRYYVYMLARPFLFFTHIQKEATAPPGSDQEDFENNFKADANKPAGVRLESFAANSVEFAGNCAQVSVTKGQTQNLDFKLTETLLCSGGFLLAKDADPGDSIKAQVVDVDGVYAPAGTILKTWIPKWYVFPNEVMRIERRQAGEILSGLYLRIAYTSVGATTDPLVTINYILERKL